MSEQETITVSRDELEAIVRAATRDVLREIGLGDEQAGDDIKKLRGVLTAWNMAKVNFWKGLWDKIGTMAAGALLFWIISKAPDVSKFIGGGQ